MSTKSTFADKRPTSGGELSIYRCILCLDTSGEVFGLGFEMSNSPGEGLGLGCSGPDGGYMWAEGWL